jgi:hypothetical protein
MTREELERQLHQISQSVTQDVCDLPDRTSPEDWPEACLVTGKELDRIVRQAIEGSALIAQARRALELEGVLRELVGQVDPPASDESHDWPARFRKALNAARAALQEPTP